MSEIILFNHIPKTGGTTFRIILNKVYGEDKVYFPKSTDLQGSYQQFENLNNNVKNGFKIIAGHGAEYYARFFTRTFTITILRNPIELFLSQYYYLKESPNSIFQEDIKQLNSIEGYFDYAIEHGQDNLLTRYLSNSIDWLIYPTDDIPEMRKEGDELVKKAKSNLHNYNAVLSLGNFDRGVYALKNLLDWKSIPLYKPVNKTKEKNREKISDKLLEKLTHLLRFDIEVYKYFIEKSIDIGLNTNTNNMAYRLFMLRQKTINKVF